MNQPTNPTPRDWAALPFLLLFVAIRLVACLPMAVAVRIGGTWTSKHILKVEYQEVAQHD